MHPNGQLPAYEWAFGDVNPPVHAWAAWRVYKIEKRIRGRADRSFLERVFHKLLLNFTWWVNRKDPDETNVFQGGFLGLDNIGVFDRSQPLPTGGHLEQSDGTSWMGMYCLNMLAISLESWRRPGLRRRSRANFSSISFTSRMPSTPTCPRALPLRRGRRVFQTRSTFRTAISTNASVCSMVGLIPLFAWRRSASRSRSCLPGFQRRARQWFDNMPGFASHVDSSQSSPNWRALLLLVDRKCSSGLGIEGRQGGILLTARRPRAVENIMRRTIFSRSTAMNIAWTTNLGSPERFVRRELELARARLGFQTNFSDDRIAPEISSLLWR